MGASKRRGCRRCQGRRGQRKQGPDPGKKRCPRMRTEKKQMTSGWEWNAVETIAFGLIKLIDPSAPPTAFGARAH